MYGYTVNKFKINFYSIFFFFFLKSLFLGPSLSFFNFRIIFSIKSFLSSQKLLFHFLLKLFNSFLDNILRNNIKRLFFFLLLLLSIALLQHLILFSNFRLFGLVQIVLALLVLLQRHVKSVCEFHNFLRLVHNYSLVCVYCLLIFPHDQVIQGMMRKIARSCILKNLL